MGRGVKSSARQCRIRDGQASSGARWGHRGTAGWGHRGTAGCGDRGSRCAPPSGRWGALRPRRANRAAHPARALRPRPFMQIWRAAQPMGACGRRCIYSRYLRSRACRSRRELCPGSDPIPISGTGTAPVSRHRPPAHPAPAKPSPAAPPGAGGFTVTPFHSHPLRSSGL